MRRLGHDLAPRHGWEPESVLAIRPRMKLVLQPSLPYPNSCLGTSPPQQGRGTASAHSTGRARYFRANSAVLDPVIADPIKAILFDLGPGEGLWRDPTDIP